MAKKGAGKKAATKKAESTRDPLLDSLEGGDAPAFRFMDEGKGATLVGRVVKFFRGGSKYGPYPGVVVKSEKDGEAYSVHCFPTVLRNQMVEADPEPGDRIAIRYLGMTSPKGGGDDYHNFTVRTDGSNKSFAEYAGDVVWAPQRDDEDEDEDIPF